MKRYQDGKMIDVPAEETKKIKERFNNRMNPNQASLSNYESRIKALEESVAKILSQLNETESE